jgi:hypothetical protein
MSSQEVIEFQPADRYAREYLELARRVHRGDPEWIAPFERATRRQLSEKNVFFRTAENRARGFGVLRNGELAGHVLATVNGRMVMDRARVGALGFVEVERDYDAFSAIVGRAVRWLASENAVARIWAPVNFDIWHGYRLMTRGYGTAAFFGEPRNAPWLPGFFERFGFTPLRRWVTVTTAAAIIRERAPRFEEAYRSALADGYRMERLRLRTQSEVATFHELVCRTFSAFLGYTPISLDEFAVIVADYLRFAGTDLASLLRDPDGRQVGFSVAFPDPTASLRDLGGHDDWLHRLRLLIRRRPNRALHYLIGILPGDDRARRALGSALFYRTLCLILDGGFDPVTFALMSADSPLRFFDTDQFDAAEREYALYEFQSSAAGVDFHRPAPSFVAGKFQGESSRTR